MSARAILEVGSSNGVSTIWLALAEVLTGGMVTGTQLIPTRAAEATRNLAEAGLHAVANVIPGDARRTLTSLSGPFDLIFIDAEKEDYPGHFEAAMHLPRSAGVILSDNVVSHDLSRYQAKLLGRADIDAVTLQIERDTEFSIKR